MKEKLRVTCSRGTRKEENEKWQEERKAISKGEMGEKKGF